HFTSARLNVTNAGTSNGTNVDIAADQNLNSQRFVLMGQADGYYEIAPKHASNMRVEVQGGLSANNTNIRIYTDNNSAAQRWKLLRQP
ncbi:MAG: hypothetical protein EOP83_22790, partial [Verrucomicrobiaceae bacterium]